MLLPVLQQRHGAASTSSSFVVDGGDDDDDSNNGSIYSKTIQINSRLPLSSRTHGLAGGLAKMDAKRTTSNENNVEHVPLKLT